MNDNNDNKGDKVFFDGDCPMCRAFVPYVDSPDKEDSVQFKNLREGNLPKDITPQQAAEKIHIRLKDGTTLKGAAAVFHIMEKNNKHVWIARLGKLPILNVLAELFYTFVAQNRFLIFGPLSRLYWCKLILCISFLIPLFITRNLWLGETFRSYPLTPVSSLLPVIPYPLDIFAVLTMAAMLIAIFFQGNPRKTCLIFFIFTLIYSLFDQSRWLPYYYQYAVMILALGFAPWEKSKDKEARLGQQAVLAIFGIILIAIWFWSGLHKINYRYWLVGYPWMISTITQYLDESTASALKGVGFFSTLVETGAAICVLFPRTRALGVILVTIMHGFILLTLGPLGQNVNYSVWSWNIAQASCAWLIFWKNPELSPRLLLFGKNVLHKAIVVLFLIMPVFNFVGLWDDFLSHALYSWSTKEAEILVKDKVTESQLPPNAAKAIEEHNGKRFIHILKWSYIEFESPPYHSFRVFKNVFGNLCRQVDAPENLQLVIFDRPPALSTKSKKHYYICKKNAQSVEIIKVKE